MVMPGQQNRSSSSNNSSALEGSGPSHRWPPRAVPSFLRPLIVIGLNASLFVLQPAFVPCFVLVDAWPC
jgi:hypothetical protein